MDEVNNLNWANPYPFAGVRDIDTMRVNQWRHSPDFYLVNQFNLQLTGSRYRDAGRANNVSGLSYLGGSSPVGCAWHHCYNLNMNQLRQYTMQLANRALHRACCPHVGAYKQGQEMGFYFNEFVDNKELDIMFEPYNPRNKYNPNIKKDIQDMEAYTGRLMPDSLTRFYIYNDFGRPEKTILYHCEDYYAISWIYPVHSDADSILEVLNFECTHRKKYGSNPLIFAQGYNIPFAEDAFGNVYYLRIDTFGPPLEDAPIYFYDHEIDQAKEIAKSFTSFYNGWFCIIGDTQM